MKKSEIFQEILSVMRTDSSTCKDRTGADPQPYLAKISDGMSDGDFLREVKSYLATFGVAGHVGFYAKDDSLSVGFSVRRFADALYVLRAEKGSGLRTGDRILRLDGAEIDEAAQKYAEFLYGEPEERQGPCWQEILGFCSTMSVASAEGGIREEPIVKGKRLPPRDPFEFRRLNDRTVLLRLDHFFDASEVKSFLTAHEREVCASRNLVIDLRENAGGSDTAFVPLLRYCLDDGVNLRDLPLEEDADEVNYTDRTAELRIRLYQHCKKNQPKEFLPYFDRQIELLRSRRGMGFVTCDGEQPFDVTGVGMPERVVVLTDCTCASSGEAFVRIARQLPKVTVAGRPTMGILDYSNLAQIDFGKYWMNYPTSRDLKIDVGKGITGKGVEVDRYIPWTPSWFEEDTDLSAVLSDLS